MITDDFSQSIAIGESMPAFELLGTDGCHYGPADFADKSLMVLVFTCNHCPYVLGSDQRLEAVVERFGSDRIAWVGICANDAASYPADSYPRMQERAASLPYTYLHDPSQAVARAFGAQVTPEFYVFGRQGDDWLLVYHGGIDDSPRDARQATDPQLAPALEALLVGEAPARPTTPVQGCSIKWLR